MLKAVLGTLSEALNIQTKGKAMKSDSNRSAPTVNTVDVRR